MNPVGALAAQTSLFSWITTPEALQNRISFMSLYARDVSDGPPPYEATDEDIKSALAHLSAEARMVRDGTPVFVTAEAMDLVDEAVEEMPSEVMLHQDLPMDSFMLWFERPLEYHPTTTQEDGSVHTERWSLDAVGIRYAPHEIFVREDLPDDLSDVTLPSVGVTPEEYEKREMYLRDGVLVYCYVSFKNVPPSEEVGVWGQVPRKDFGPYGLIDFVGVGFDVDWAERDIDTPARKLHKWLIALMRLMGEHIELVRSGAPRAMRRAAVRSGRTVPENGYLSILHLRHVAYAMKESGESDDAHRLRWKHRVRGHWQRFYCASRGFPVGHAKAYRHRYVNSYVRGPGELIESTRVVVVDR